MKAGTWRGCAFVWVVVYEECGDEWSKVERAGSVYAAGGLHPEACRAANATFEFSYLNVLNQILQDECTERLLPTR